MSPPPKKLWSVADLIAVAAPPEWVVDQILPAGSVVLVVGEPKKARKSFTLMDLGCNVARGTPWLGRFMTRTRQVVYTSFEDGPQRIGWRLQLLGFSLQDADVRLRYTFDADAFVDMRAAMDADGVEPALWVIDTLADLAALHGVQDENNSVEMAALLSTYRKIAQNRGHVIVIIHHPVKGQLVYRGSGAIAGSVDGWWEFGALPRSSNIVQVRPILRDGEAGPWHIRCTAQLDRRVIFDTPSQAEVESAGVAGEAAQPPGAPPKKRANGAGNGVGNGHANGVESNGALTARAAAVRALLRDNIGSFWTRSAIAGQLSFDPRTVASALETLEQRGEVRAGANGQWIYLAKKD